MPLGLSLYNASAQELFDSSKQSATFFTLLSDYTITTKLPNAGTLSSPSSQWAAVQNKPYFITKNTYPVIGNILNSVDYNLTSVYITLDHILVDPVTQKDVNRRESSIAVVTSDFKVKASYSVAELTLVYLAYQQYTEKYNNVTYNVSDLFRSSVSIYGFNIGDGNGIWV